MKIELTALHRKRAERIIERKYVESTLARQDQMTSAEICTVAYTIVNVNLLFVRIRFSSYPIETNSKFRNPAHLIR